MERPLSKSNKRHVEPSLAGLGFPTHKCETKSNDTGIALVSHFVCMQYCTGVQNLWNPDVPSPPAVTVADLVLHSVRIYVFFTYQACQLDNCRIDLSRISHRCHFLHLSFNVYLFCISSSLHETFLPRGIRTNKPNAFVKALSPVYGAWRC